MLAEIARVLTSPNQIKIGAKELPVLAKTQYMQWMCFFQKMKFATPLTK